MTTQEREEQDEQKQSEILEQNEATPEDDVKNGSVDDDDEAPKPPPTFNGALSQFVFNKTSSATTTIITTTTKTVAKTTVKTTAKPTAKTAAPSRRQTHSSTTSKRSASTPSSPRKRSKTSRFYAPPSKYAHLGGVPDAFLPSLICVFIGLNPGIATATAGHAYSSPSNLFWRLLHWSGITPDKQVPPVEDQTLPLRYSLGHTNLVSRPTKDQRELSKAEMVASASVLEEKIRKWRPEAVCVVGKGIWESMWEGKHGRAISKNEFKFGWQEESERCGAVEKNEEEGGEEEWEGAKVFVVPSTSGLAASYSLAFKKEIWTELGVWIDQRRKERGLEVVPGGVPARAVKAEEEKT